MTAYRILAACLALLVGLSPVVSLAADYTREVRFDGRLRTADDPTTIGPNDFQQLQNLRYGTTHPKAVGGQTKINTSALASTGLKNGFHFRKSFPSSESHVLVWSNDAKVWRNATAIPSAGAFAGSPTAWWTDAAGGTTGRFSVTPQGGLAYATGAETVFWGGTEFRLSGFLSETDAAGTLKDSTELLSNTINDASNRVEIVAVGSAVTFYVGSIMPIDGFKLYIQTGNEMTSGTATMNVQYWSSTSWDNCSSIVDGTVVSGRSLEQTGAVTFTSTASTAKQIMLNGVSLYWYKVTVTTGGSVSGDAHFTPYSVTVSIPAQTMPGKELWDGSVVPLHVFWLNNGAIVGNKTQAVYALDYAVNTETTTCVNLSNFDNSSKWWVIGYPTRLQGFTVGFGSTDSSWLNGTASVMQVSYWNGTAWTALTVTDGTKNAAGTVSLSKDGIVSWTPPAEGSESPTMDYADSPGGDKPATEQTPLYVYKVGFSSGATDGNTYVDQVQAIPASSMVRPHAFPVEHQTRLCLFDEYGGKRNQAQCSSAGTVNVFMGQDSPEWRFGGEEPLIAATSLYSRFGSTIADLLVIAKRTETWVVQGTGTDQDPWKQYAASKSIGCIAPLTMASVPFGDDMGGALNRTIAVWLTDSGMVGFDGQNFSSLTDAIADLFDPRSANYIGASTLPTCSGWYDPVYREYHLVVPGTAEWVWDVGKPAIALPNGKKVYAWHKVERTATKRLWAGFPVYDTSGIGYSYGLDNAGLMYRLENGTTFDGQNIVSTLWTADIALNQNRISVDTPLDGLKLIQRAKATTTNNVTCTIYGNTDTTGVTGPTFDPTASGKRVSNVYKDIRTPAYNLASFKFSLTTSDETVGFEPIFMSVYYEPVAIDRRVGE